MLTKFGILVIAACAYSTTALPRCVCARNYQPMCGTDGVTYSNQCMLDCHSAQLDYLGECNSPPPPDCICTQQYQPVCGSDGKSYGNACELNCATARNSRLSIAYNGLCKDDSPSQPECICTQQYEPVCGSDGKSYGNACELNCATAQNSRLSIAYNGLCKDDSPSQPDCICTEQYQPVCGSDGRTYGNDCELNCATARNSMLSIAYNGQCIEDSPSQPDCICTQQYGPVCGSDGKSYGNACELNCATARNSRLSIAYNGLCKDDSPSQPDCICTEQYEPVCGSDRKTYANACELNCATANNPSLSIVRRGRCLSLIAKPLLSRVKVAESEARLSPEDVAETEASGSSPVNVAESNDRHARQVSSVNVDEPEARYLSPVNVANPPVSPVNVANPPLSPVNVANPSLSPVNVANPSLSPVNVVNPPLSPVNVANPQVSPVNVANPQVSPVNVAYPPLSPVSVANPSLSPVNVADPSLSPVNVADPSLSPVNVADPSLSPVNVADPSLSPVNVADPSIPPVLARTV